MGNLAIDKLIGTKLVNVTGTDDITPVSFVVPKPSHVAQLPAFTGSKGLLNSGALLFVLFVSDDEQQVII